MAAHTKPEERSKGNKDDGALTGVSPAVVSLRAPSRAARALNAARPEDAGDDMVSRNWITPKCEILSVLSSATEIGALYSPAGETEI